jgi:hypothetical protein
MARKAAIEIGRRYGEDEATKRRELGDVRDQRVRRAMAYAAWEFDSKPAGVDYQKEFGIHKHELVESLERPVPKVPKS